MKQGILKRWQSLHEGSGLRHAQRVTLILRVTGLVLLAAVVAGIAMGVHAAIIVFLAAAMGWLIAETNALRLRLAQWPIMEAYIDWARVRADSKTGSEGEDNRSAQPPVPR